MTLELTNTGLVAIWLLLGLIVVPNVVLFVRTSNDLELVVLGKESEHHELLLTLIVMVIWPWFVVMGFKGVFTQGHNGTCFTVHSAHSETFDDDEEEEIDD